jgi:hypothetical protein
VDDAALAEPPVSAEAPAAEDAAVTGPPAPEDAAIEEPPAPAVTPGFETYIAPAPARPPAHEPPQDAPAITPPPAEAAPPPAAPPPAEAAPPPPAPVTPPEPVAPVPEPVAAFQAPPRDDGAPTVMPNVLTAPPTPIPTKRREPREKRERPSWLLPAGIGLAVLVAAVLGFILAGSGGSKAPSVETPTAAAGNDSLEMLFPPSWKRIGSGPAIPGVKFDNPIAFTTDGSASGPGVVFGQVTDGASNSTLLSAELRAAAGFKPTDVPKRKAVKLARGNVQAYEYENLSVKGVPGKLTMFTAPTSAGVATVACTAAVADCEAIANTLKLRDGEALPVGPSKAFGDAVSKALASVSSATKSGRAQLKSAKTNKSQAPVARKVSLAYDQAAQSVEGLDVSPADATLKSDLVDDLRAGQQAWKQLSTAAAKHDKPAYGKAEDAIAAAETKLQNALKGLQAAGYSVR